MSKAHRGKPLREEMPQAGRAQCPACKRTGIKVHYEYTVGEDKYKVCKPCKAALNRGKSLVLQPV